MSWFEREEKKLDELFFDGKISLHEYSRDLKELFRDFRDGNYEPSDLDIEKENDYNHE